MIIFKHTNLSPRTLTYPEGLITLTLTLNYRSLPQLRLNKQPLYAIRMDYYV